MIEARVNNLTAQSIGYYQFPALPRVGEGIFFPRDDGEYSNRFEVVDVTYRQQIEHQPLEVEVSIKETT